MILQSLARYYDILAQDPDSGIAPPGYSTVGVSYSLNLSLSGELVDIFTEIHSEPRGKKSFDVPRAMILPEQVKRAGISPTPNFLWDNSAFVGVKGCMDCHMPVAEGGIQLSITGGPARTPFSQHSFVGSNAFMLNILRYFGEEIGVTTSSAELAARVLETETLVGTQAAALRLENLALNGSTLSGEVVVESLVGHKFPGGYPSRRAWLHITVRDAAGAIVFESGAVSPDGYISGNDNDDDPSRFEPHYATLTAPDQVQIYESIMLNSDGEVTTVLLRAAAYAKDNRLLPQGFDLAAATPDILVFGAAAQDADFTGGGDRLGLQLDLGAATGPFTVQVELLYQSIGYRWAQNLMQDATPEALTFGGYYATVPNLPLVAARVEGTVAP